MNVSCPNCNTTYRVDPAKVPETGVRARCAVCSAVFLVRRDGAAAPVPAALAPVSPPPGPSPATVPAPQPAPPPRPPA
ncbi:MAG TPA: zinc-ribbon domain-containing protein, partial [Gemmatimonadales bacterium]